MAVETSTPYRRVVGTLIRGVGDGLLGTPSGIPLAGAKVVAEASIRSATSDHYIAFDPVEGITDNNAVLRNAITGEPGLLLIVTDDPSVGIVDWTWHITITAPTLTRPIEFDMPVPSGEGDLDLSTLDPVPGSGGEVVYMWREEVRAAANDAVEVAAERFVGDQRFVFRTDLGTPRTVVVDHPEFTHVVHSYDFRQIGGQLRDEDVMVGGTIPGYRASLLGSGIGQVLLTRDFRRIEPGGEHTADGRTPQSTLDEWSKRMSLGVGFTAVAGWGDSMTMDYQAQGLSQTQALAEELGVVGFDRGVSGDTPQQIAWRMGAARVLVSVPGNSITTTAAACTVSPASGWNQTRTQHALVRDLDSGGMVRVILVQSETTPTGTPTWTIRRASAGSDVRVLPATRVKHAQAVDDDAKSLPAKFWVGRNGSNANRALVLASLRQMVQAHRDPRGRRLISPVFNSSGEPAGSPQYAYIMGTNAAIADAHSDDFFDSRSALINLGPMVAGVTVTAGDANHTAIQEDCIPPVFMLDTTHLNVLGRRTLARIDAMEIAGRSW